MCQRVQMLSVYLHSKEGQEKKKKSSKSCTLGLKTLHKSSLSISVLNIISLLYKLGKTQAWHLLNLYLAFPVLQQQNFLNFENLNEHQTEMNIRGSLM